MLQGGRVEQLLHATAHAQRMPALGPLLRPAPLSEGEPRPSLLIGRLWSVCVSFTDQTKCIFDRWLMFVTIDMFVVIFKMGLGCDVCDVQDAFVTRVSFMRSSDETSQSWW